MGRIVYVSDLGVMGEVVAEQLYGAYVKYQMGGFEVTEFMTADDYEDFGFFEEDEDDN